MLIIKSVNHEKSFLKFSESFKHSVWACRFVSLVGQLNANWLSTISTNAHLSGLVSGPENYLIHHYFEHFVQMGRLNLQSVEKKTQTQLKSQPKLRIKYIDKYDWLHRYQVYGLISQQIIYVTLLLSSGLHYFMYESSMMSLTWANCYGRKL